MVICQTVLHDDVSPNKIYIYAIFKQKGFLLIYLYKNILHEFNLKVNL
jgi:hypothetical protein